MATASARGLRSKLIGALIAVVVVALLAVFVWPGLGGNGGDGAADDGAASTVTEDGQAGPQDPPVRVAEPQILPMAVSDKVPTPEGVAAQLADALDDPDVASLVGIVIDPDSGQVLWEHNADRPRVPASTMKLITGAALLSSVDPNKRWETKVVKGEQPGEIVFVGGGDITLSARQDGTPTMLIGGPTVRDLAEQIQAAGVEVTSITLDISYWTGEEMAAGWSIDDVRGTPLVARGYITLMQALMVDADRNDPADEDSTRTGEPAMTAGKALARALGDEDIPLTFGSAPDDAETIAAVYSQPMLTLLAQSLEHSDNVLSEALAREVAIARGVAPSFAGVSAATIQALQDMDIDTTGVVVKDGSGLSNSNEIPIRVLGEVMANAVSGDDPGQRNLLTGLPLAGVSGTLAPPRFSQDSNRAGAGWVRAKTGSLGDTYALVGYVPDQDGHLLVFALNSAGVISSEDPNVGTRPAQDALAAALRGCGCDGS